MLLLQHNVHQVLKTYKLNYMFAGLQTSMYFSIHYTKSFTRNMSIL